MCPVSTLTLRHFHASGSLKTNTALQDPRLSGAPTYRDDFVGGGDDGVESLAVVQPDSAIWDTHNPIDVETSSLLNGLIRRGDGENIRAVIWFCDLRDSIPLAQSMSRDEFLASLNEFLDSVADAVLDQGGQILRFISEAANLAARIESMCKLLEEPVLLSGEFADCIPDQSVSLGQHALKGINEPQEIFALRASE